MTAETGEGRAGTAAPESRSGRARGSRLVTPVALTIAMIAVSSSAPLIAYPAAPPALGLAFWRNALAVLLLLPLALTRWRAELAFLLRPEGRRTGLACLAAGTALAVHFGTWVPAARLTTAAAATALGATMPVWAALVAAARGVRVPRTTWTGIGVAVLGAALATGADVAVSGTAVVGDALAAAGGAAAAAYATLGEGARGRISTTTYTLVCYAWCACLLGGADLVAGVPLTGYDRRGWLVICALVAGPQLLGHSLINFALDRVPATLVSVLLLLEVPGAALLAWLWLGQTPAPRSAPGLVLMLAGVAVVLGGAAVTRRTAVPRSRPSPPPPRDP